MECIVCYEPFTGSGSKSHSSPAACQGLGNSSTAKTPPSAAAGSEEAAAAAAVAATPIRPKSKPGPASKKKKAEELKKIAQSRKVSEVICTPCGHVFHRACITGWLQTESGNAKALSGTCPNCRSKFRLSALYPVYFSFDRSPSPPPPPAQRKPPTLKTLAADPFFITSPPRAPMPLPTLLDHRRGPGEVPFFQNLSFMRDLDIQPIPDPDPVHLFATQYARSHFSKETGIQTELTPATTAMSLSNLTAPKTSTSTSSQSPSPMVNGCRKRKRDESVEVIELPDDVEAEEIASTNTNGGGGNWNAWNGSRNSGGDPLSQSGVIIHVNASAWNALNGNGNQNQAQAEVVQPQAPAPPQQGSQGECTKPDCEDLRMLLRLAQSDIADLQKSVSEWRQKYEAALTEKAIADVQLENFKDEMQARINLLSRGLFPQQ